MLGEYGDLVIMSYKDPSSVRHNYLKKSHVVSFEAVDPTHVLDVLESIVDDESVSAESKSFLLTTLLKLSDRFDDEVVSRIVSLLDRFRTSKDLELQQRACE